MIKLGAKSKPDICYRTLPAADLRDAQARARHRRDFSFFLGGEIVDLHGIESDHPAHVASTATRSVPIATKPSARGRPMIGPSPFHGCDRIDDGEVRPNGRVEIDDRLRNSRAGAARSSASRRPRRARCRTGSSCCTSCRPKWCVFSFGIEMTKSDCSNVHGNASLAQTGEPALQRDHSDVVVIEVHEPNSLFAQLIGKAGRRRRYSMSRRCPGPSPMTTSDAPARRQAIARPATHADVC